MRVDSPGDPSSSAPPEKVLFLDHTAKLGGGEIALLNLLVHLDQSRFHPIVVLGEEGPLADKIRELGIELHVLPLPGAVGDTRKDSLGAGSLLKIGQIVQVVGYSWTLSRLMKTVRARIIHTNSLKADLIGGVAARWAGLPVVWHIRDRIDGDYLPKIVSVVFRLLCRLIPDFVVANSGATLRTLHLTGAGRKAVVHSGYALVQGSSAVVHDGVVPGDTVSKNSSAPLVGLVGRITRWKGQHVFLEAVSLVRHQFPAARFQIIGSAMFGEEAYEKEIRAQAAALKVEDCVDFLGFRSDVQALIQQLDVLVHASITGEPFGQVIIEAMAASRPVIATRGGGVPEIVRDGVTGILVPMGDVRAMSDAMCELLANPEKAEQMGVAGRKHILRRFTAEATARRLEHVFDKVLIHRRITKLSGACQFIVAINILRL